MAITASVGASLGGPSPSLCTPGLCTEAHGDQAQPQTGPSAMLQVESRTPSSRAKRTLRHPQGVTC